MHKTLLMLGGSDSQVVAIEKAHNLGCRTVLCDYLPDNPGRRVADLFYQTSTTDKDAILEIASRERIDGIVAYGSDPAAPTAAYVAEALGLPGVPYQTAKCFCEKNLFRSWLLERGFCVPKSIVIQSGHHFCDTEQLNYPLIVKPDDSSGSKGVSVVGQEMEMDAAVAIARGFSRDGLIIAEEFIERDHPHVIEAEVFVADGKVCSWGLVNSIRDQSANPLLPAAYTYPLSLDYKRENLVRREISRLVEEAGIRYGACNLEMVIDFNNNLYFLDAGPRNGGNRLPEFMQMISGKDLVEATLLAALGEYDRIDASMDCAPGYFGMAVLHTGDRGYFKCVKYSTQARSALRQEYITVKQGDIVSGFHVCSDLIGLALFQFNSAEEMGEIMEHSKKHIEVVLQ